jgi:hypothetical protein
MTRSGSAAPLSNGVKAAVSFTTRPMTSPAIVNFVVADMSTTSV